MTDAEILRGAVKALQTRGHAKGWLMDETGAVCARGAMLDAQNVEWIRSTSGCSRLGGDKSVFAWDRVMEIEQRWIIPAAEAYGIALPETSRFQGRVVEFNNDPATSSEDVILLFKHALEMAEAAENPNL